MITNPKSEEFQLLDAAAATGDGEWIYIGDYDKWSLMVTGITTATVQIWQSNAPLDTSDQDSRELQYGSDITADGIVYSDPDQRFAWLRVKVSAYTSGAIYADLHLYKQ